MADTSKLYKEKHIKYFKRVLQVLPGQYASLDTHRMTMAFFAISGLDLLGALHEIEKERASIIDWIYSLQVLPDNTEKCLARCGFRGSSTLGNSFCVEKREGTAIWSDSGHIAMTYTALASLLVLGDNLEGVNKAAVLAGLQALQQKDGSFSSVPEGSETDMRFVYCAACISYILDDWSGVNTSKAVDYILKSISYEGAMGQGPGTEAHGGPTFCAVASLFLMKKLNSTLSPKQCARLKKWCIMRQESGFQGRPNKPVDTCYSFWVGATLQILGILDLTDFLFNRTFILSTQSSVTGGMAKWIDNPPDPLHTYLGLCGLSLIGEPGLLTLHASLNISQRAADHLSDLHRLWHRLNSRHSFNMHI